MIEPRLDLEIKDEWLVARTLAKVHEGKALVQLENLGSTT